MSIIKCGVDEQGEYIELTRPKGESHPCFIDANGVLQDKVRIYQPKIVRELSLGSECVMCGKYVPEGSMVCKSCREAVGSCE